MIESRATADVAIRILQQFPSVQEYDRHYFELR